MKHDTLLICSGVRENRRALRRVFSDAFPLLESGDIRQLVQLLNQNLSCIAAVLLDVSGWETADTEWITRVEHRELLSKVPVIILVEQDTPKVLNEVFEFGAADVIPIGYDPHAMLRRVENIVELPLSEQQSEDAIRRIRGKYYALVHYINGLMVDLDLDRKLFHLVYNPYPEFAFLQERNTLEEMGQILCDRFVHPMDREKMECFLGQEIHRFLEKGLRRASYRIRAKGPNPEGTLFELTLMRINPMDNSRRALSVLAKKVTPETFAKEEADQVFVPLEGTFRFRNDNDFTLVNLLQQKLQRYEMILAQTENVLFEWDMEPDTISFSDTWEKIFGYQAPDGDCRWGQRWMDFLYPDDMPLMADCISSLRNGSPYEMTEVRIATARGRYLWCRFRATAIRDAKGNLQKITGIIINIDSEKQAEQALQNRADHDSLTKLLNKDAARKQAEEYFSRYSESTGGALLIIDLDDFKQVNDRKGHLFGDSVLMKVSQEIRKLFRGQDIVARIGGDEFLVVMRGVTDRQLLEQRCSQLLQLLGNAFRSYNISVGCSIGIALAPEHGNAYVELFQHADQALYQVKSKGKNSYAIYNPADAGYLNQPGRTAMVSNPIDSDSEPGMANDTIVRYAFRKLYSSQNVEKSINELLAFIGGKTNVSRVYVFENSEDNRFCSNTYEWCNQGIPSEIENLQNISYETDIPGYADNYDEQGIFYCPDVALLPKNVYDIVAPQGIKAMLHCAIRENGVFRGYIGFDDCKEPRMWTREQIEILTFFSEALSMFLLRQRRQEKVQRQADEMRFILDSQDAWIYVVDPETHTLLHINSRLREKHPGIRPGMTCYKALENQNVPLPECPMRMMGDKNNYSCLLRDRYPGEPILLESTRIQWDGKEAVLVSGRNLPK